MQDNKVTKECRKFYTKNSMHPRQFRRYWNSNLINVTTVDFELTFGNANEHGLGLYSWYIEEIVDQKAKRIKPKRIEWMNE